MDHIVKPDLVAPGNRIISLTQGGTVLMNNSSLSTNQFPQWYYIKGGSSEVSPMYYKLSEPAWRRQW